MGPGSEVTAKLPYVYIFQSFSDHKLESSVAMHSRAAALSAKTYFWKMLDGKSSSTVKRVSSAASAVEYSFHLGFIIIFFFNTLSEGL